jgi:flagellar operon protein
MESSSLNFSKHAAMRLTDRNIDLTEDMNRRLENGVEQAGKKGVCDSLVLVDSLAFIVNVPSRTVVTAMDQTETNSNVFTNIDGAVII